MLTTDIPGTKSPTPAESDDALRYLKASEATEAALVAAGYRAAPDAVRAMIASSVKSKTEGIPVGSLSSSSGLMAAAAVSEVNAAIASLSESQRERLKRSEEPDAATLAAIRRNLHDGLGSLRAFGAGTPADGGGSRDSYGGDGGKTMGASIRSNDYQILGLSSAESLQRLSSGNWGRDPASIPFVKAGVNFGTVDYLRKYDKSFTGKDVLKAAGDVKQLGFDVNDKRAMRDHAVIRHYDNDPDGTNDAEKKFKAGVDNDQDMQDLLRRRGLCKDPVQQKALDSLIDEHKKHHLEDSGLQRRIDDPKNHPKARAAIKDDVDHIIQKNQDFYLHHGNQPTRGADEHKLKPPANKGASLDRAHNQMAKKVDETPAGKTIAAADDVFGAAAPAKKAETPTEPTKPAPIKSAENKSKGPKLSVG